MPRAAARVCTPAPHLSPWPLAVAPRRGLHSNRRRSRCGRSLARAPSAAARCSPGAQKDKGTCRFELEGHEDEFYDYYDLHALADDSPNWHEEVLETGLSASDDEAEGDKQNAAADGKGKMEHDDVEYIRVHVVYRPAAAVDGAAAGAGGRSEGLALVIGSGRELGHRSLRRFYGQSYRVEQPEQAQVHRLLLHYQQMGVVRAALLAPGGPGMPRSDRARRDITRQQRSQLGLGLKNNTLMKKRGQPSQNIIFS
jgi:hypothetical protein